MVETSINPWIKSDFVVYYCVPGLEYIQTYLKYSAFMPTILKKTDGINFDCCGAA